MAAASARKKILWTVVAVVVLVVVGPRLAQRILPGGAQTTDDASDAVTLGQTRPETVRVATETVQKGPFPLIIATAGTVQPIASVAVRSRIDAEIAALPVADGSYVKKGQLLASLDSRQVSAQIEQAKATLAKDQATADEATRNLTEAQDLLKSGAGPQTAVATDTTASLAAQATLQADQAQIDNLNVQLTWYSLYSPIDGRVGTFSSKVGNILRTGDTTATGVLVTVNQLSPVYVAFSVEQASLPDLRQAMAAGTATVTALPDGLDASKTQTGKIAEIDNAIDPASGSVTVRAVFDNPGEILWPGQLCQVTINVRVDPDTVSVSQAAVRPGQTGSFVYVVNDDDTAHYQPVTVSRLQDGRAVISAGLNGGESVADTNQLELVEGAKVTVASN